MPRDLKNLAKKSLTLCELMTDREKIDTEDIIKYYPDGITLREFEHNVQTENGATVVYLFDEEPDKFAFGGKVIQNLIESLIEDYEGDISELKADLKATGLKIKLASSKTKKGLPVTTVEVVD